jgi:hypothetical protein
VYLAEYYPKGPSQTHEPFPYLRVVQSLAPASWSDFHELHEVVFIPWYGDIALAESGDGGAVFFWSQVTERFGLFARRFNNAGEVTSVETRAAESQLALTRLRFVAGDGVRVSLSLPAGEQAGLDLFDVTGRRVAATRLSADGAREVTLPGTRVLAAGLYFAKLTTRRGSLGGKVIVAR